MARAATDQKGMDSMTTSETGTGAPLDGLDGLGAEWAGWACSLSIALGYAAYCAWQLRGCFAEALDVARGWRLAATSAIAAGVAVAQAAADVDVERSQAARDGAGEGDRL